MSTATASFLAHAQQHFARPKTLKRKAANGKPKKRHLTPVEVAVQDARRRAISGDWSNAKATAFVGLHCLCHQMIYGITPLELEQPILFQAAARCAANAVRTHFNQDPSEMAEFVRWTWVREKRLNSWAQQKQFDRKRLSWRFQFSNDIVTDFRIAQSQRRA